VRHLIRGIGRRQTVVDNIVHEDGKPALGLLSC
jgi:hypothetical protein